MLRCPKCGSTRIDGVEDLFCRSCGKRWERRIQHCDDETMEAARAAQRIQDAVAESVAETLRPREPDYKTDGDRKAELERYLEELYPSR